MVASLQSHGDDPSRFHPHLHSLVSQGLVSRDGSFVSVAAPDPACLVQLFRHKLVTALLAREKISPRLVEIMGNWVHPGFSVFQGEAISPDDHQARRRLAAYLVHPPISLQRLRYRPETGQVIYYGRQRAGCGDAGASPARIVSALDFLAALCLHVPDSGHQLVRYYGAFSNARRVSPAAPPSASAPPAAAQAVPQEDSACGEDFARGRRRSWARLIKKVYEADPLICARCAGPLKIISLIGDAPVIEKILRHLKIWDRPERPPPPPAVPSIHYDDPIVNYDETDPWPDASA
jgi:hypothetical protein